MQSLLSFWAGVGLLLALAFLGQYVRHGLVPFGMSDFGEGAVLGILGTSLLFTLRDMTLSYLFGVPKEEEESDS